MLLSITCTGWYVQEFYTLNDNEPFEYQYRTDIAFYVPAASPANLVGEISSNIRYYVAVIGQAFIK